VTARRLLAWGDREDRRRRGARTGLARLAPGGWSGLAAAVLAGETARRLGRDATATDVTDASRLWIACALAGFAVVVLGAPFRLYWRRDAALLTRLPIGGGALYRLAALRSLRAAGWVALPCLAAAAVFAPLASWPLALRHGELALVTALGAGLLGPAAALLGGLTVASERAMAALDSIAGEFRGPKTTWLGFLPGLAAAALAALILAAAPWAAGSATTAVGSVGLLFGSAAAVTVATFAATLVLAPGHARAAVREVAALDQERFAHVERTRVSWLERGFARLALPAAGARLVFDKDVRLAHRRHPAPYFLGALGVVALWIVAAWAPADGLAWAGAILGCLAAYDVVMARRLAAPPIEHAPFLASLAVAGTAVAAAKRRHVLLRVLLTLTLGGVPVVWRSAEVGATAALFGTVAAATWLIGIRLATRPFS
jgi:hypothetical protein